MGSIDTIQNELNQVLANIKYVKKEKDLGEKFHANSIIFSQINKIEEVMNTKYREQGILKSLFGNDLDFSLEKSEIEKLKNKLQDTKLFQQPKNIVEFKNKCNAAIENLEKYKKILNKSLPLAFARQQIREESIENKRKNLDDKARQKSIEEERAKALAAAHTNKTRQLATSVKSRLSEQRVLLDFCPYCSNDLGAYPHADHIYPVAKGGLSTIENMVYVCQQCNSKKSDKTLFEFINSSSAYDFNVITSNLHRLKKKF